eukprot:scaffold66395_cov23-Prasinocladus_malaysianus.AAC.1
MLDNVRLASTAVVSYIVLLFACHNGVAGKMLLADHFMPYYRSMYGNFEGTAIYGMGRHATSLCTEMVRYGTTWFVPRYSVKWEIGQGPPVPTPGPGQSCESSLQNRTSIATKK